MQGTHGCLHTSRLWVAKGNSPYRLVYLIPPKRDSVENGMKVLGWAPGSRMVLVQSEQWQYGSDAPDSQQILGFYMGKNTPERKDYIMANLVVPVEE